MRSLTHGTERGGQALRVTALLTLAIGLFALPSSASAVAPGGFDQLAGPAGCLTNGGSGGVCTSTHDLGGVFEIVISPDGRNLYATGSSQNTLSVFDRNPNTGALTQKGGNQGCFVNGAATATCQSARFFGDPLGMAMSKDGLHLYVAAFNNNVVLTFDRDPATGALTAKPGPAGCISGDNTVQGASECRDARAMNGPYYLARSQDGGNLYVAAFNSDSVTALRIESDGSLTQIGDGSGGSGCVENVPSADGCANGNALDGPFAMNVAEETIYPAAYNDASVSALARDPNTGRLSPVSGATGCVDREGTDGCTTVPELSTIRGLVGAPGNQHLYVAVEGTSRVLLFDRLSSGGLQRRAGVDGCVSNGAVAGCTTGRALGAPAGITASSDGDDIYVASQNSGSGLVELDRSASGVLTPRGDSRGCAVFNAPPANCALTTGLSSMYDVELSPDGRNIYVSASGNASHQQLAVFRRDSQGPVCGNAAQTVTQGSLTTLKIPCSDVDGDPVDVTAPITPPTIGTLGALDQANDQIPYAASQGQCGTTSFTYRGSSSGQTSGTGTFTLTVVGCSTGGGGGGGPTAPTLIPSTVSNNWAAARTFTTVISLSAKRLPTGASVVVKCKTKSKRLQKKRCPYKSKSFKAPAGKNQVNLAKLFRKKKLPVGTKITITITAPTFIGKVFTYTTRRRAIPRLKLQCLAPGATKAGSCPG